MCHTAENPSTAAGAYFVDVHTYVFDPRSIDISASRPLPPASVMQHDMNDTHSLEGAPLLLLFLQCSASNRQKTTYIIV